MNALLVQREMLDKTIARLAKGSQTVKSHPLATYIGGNPAIITSKRAPRINHKDGVFLPVGRQTFHPVAEGLQR